MPILKIVERRYIETPKSYQLIIFKNRYLCKDTISLPCTMMKKIIPIEEGDYYLTPEGYRCFTEQYHLKRGYCCQSVVVIALTVIIKKQIQQTYNGH